MRHAVYFTLQFRRLTNRRIGRIGFVVILVSLFIVQQSWHYWRLSQVHPETFHGNISWEIDETESNAVQESCSPNENCSRPSLSSAELSRFIAEANSQQLVTNQQLYGQLPSPSEPNLTTSPSAVFLVQIHNRIENLRALIESLSRVRGIEHALLVFSSDFVSNDTIELIRSISFARVIQIYFPHNTQVFPNAFPGKDPQDCDSNITVNQAKRNGCVNVDWFDTFSHYRNSKFSQVKHHWLWKLAFLFERLHAVKNYTGYVILLEEDHYVVEDLLHVNKLAGDIWNPIEAKGLVVFGSYSKDQNYENPRVTFHPWISSRDNMGIGISRTMWNRIKKCLTLFCTFDDYNWDWTLQHIGSHCLQPALTAMQFEHQTRVYHLGQCDGLHHKSENCSVRLLAQQITQNLQGPASSHLFPARLKISDAHKGSFKMRPNGGWSDPRDVALCKSIATSSWQPEITKYAPHLTEFAIL